MFYAGCKTESGIVIVLGWNTDADHRAFRKQITAHLKSAGLPRPTNVERLTIAKLGWTDASATATSRTRNSIVGANTPRRAASDAR